MLKTIGLIAALILPFWNIPLILRIHHRKSSSDISLAWVVGVFLSLCGMLPSGLVSPDIIFRSYSLINFIFFSAVVIQVFRYR